MIRFRCSLVRVISDTGRGILSLSNSDLIVEGVTIYNPLWHAISVQGFTSAVANIKEAFITNPQGAGMYFENTNVFVSNDVVTGSQEGGIVCFQSTVSILNSTLSANGKHGILLVRGLQTAFINGNLIEDTKPYAYPDCAGMSDGCEWGDGVTMVHTTATFTENSIINAWRAGLCNFGGHANLSDNIIECAAFSLEGEDYQGQDYSFSNNVLDNACGCPTAINGSCVAVSAGLEPPEPLPGN